MLTFDCIWEMRDQLECSLDSHPELWCRSDIIRAFEEANTYVFGVNGVSLPTEALRLIIEADSMIQMATRKDRLVVMSVEKRLQVAGMVRKIRSGIESGDKREFQAGYNGLMAEFGGSRAEGGNTYVVNAIRAIVALWEDGEEVESVVKMLVNYMEIEFRIEV